MARLRQRVRLQTRRLESDDQGGYRERWQDLGEFWAELTPQRGVGPHHAQNLGQQLQVQPSAALVYGVVFRIPTPVTAESRLIWRDKVLSVIGEPMVNERAQTIELIVAQIKKETPLANQPQEQEEQRDAL
ncbi:MAG: head-tail adaptor protein [Holosporales bacterium]